MKPHVLVCRLDSDGDVLLAGPAIRAVAAGARRVTLLCGPRGRAAAELLPGVDEVLVFHCPWIDATPPPVDRAEVLALVDALASRGVDEAIVLTSFHQSPLPTALLLRMAGIARIGATSVDYPGSLLDVRHRISDDVHEVERSLALVAEMGHRLPDGDDGRLAVRAAPPRDEHVPARPFVVVHPGASVPSRALPAEAAARAVQLLADEGWHVVVTGGPAERPLTAAVAGPGRPEVVDLGGATSLAELAGLLQRAAALVVGNTGPAHLAAAVGTPVVEVFAPTVPAVRWRPWQVPHVLLGDQDIACAGCRARACPHAEQACVAHITGEDIAAAVRTAAEQVVGAA